MRNPHATISPTQAPLSHKGPVPLCCQPHGFLVIPVCPSAHIQGRKGGRGVDGSPFVLTAWLIQSQEAPSCRVKASAGEPNANSQHNDPNGTVRKYPPSTGWPLHRRTDAARRSGACNFACNPRCRAIRRALSSHSLGARVRRKTMGAPVARSVVGLCPPHRKPDSARTLHHRRIK